jgi:hypothetical protein
MTTSIQHKAACLAALYYLVEQAGGLDGFTRQDIADVLELGNRSGWKSREGYTSSLVR